MSNVDYNSPEFKKAVQAAVENELSRIQTSKVPDKFITFDELRVAESDEVSDLLLMPVQGTNETVVFRLSDIADHIAPNATGNLYGLVKISSNAIDSHDTAASTTLVKSIKDALSTLNENAYLKTGGPINGDCTASNFSTTGNVWAAGQINAQGGIGGRYLVIGEGIGANGVIKSRGDIVAFDPSATRNKSESYAKLTRVLGAKPVAELGTLDLIEKLASALDSLVAQLNFNGIDVGFDHDE
ncbi:hypothetical protein IHC92_20810 [Photobacterium damselae subsp. damselae]|uniref:hypothetical protein n=1 Tax=Photobacterium damselae TaxID=38293 RepID=UPI001F3FC0B0|nr:hypothetical protein [Photobacterium damselae]UKA23396.1 hypothetical protein IHC92_20810 [Photobacterium damselae subsp. damselae]